tara:strand:+ start:32005 stop:32496 length:492 start_codon:yes stop_codon:yes gene_type:complete
MTRIVLCMLVLGTLLSACVGPSRAVPPQAGDPLRDKLERASLALREARLLDAEVMYRELSVSHPRLPEVWLQLGNIYTRQAQLEAAMRAYKDGLKYTREDGRLWHNLAVVELKQAIQTLETASQVLPADSPYRGHINQLHGRLLSGADSQATADTVGRAATNQ